MLQQNISVAAGELQKEIETLYQVILRKIVGRVHGVEPSDIKGQCLLGHIAFCVNGTIYLILWMYRYWCKYTALCVNIEIIYMYRYMYVCTGIV